MERSATLFTFAISHYCEKARWALDLSGLQYREQVWAPGPHILLARRLAAETTVPILKAGRQVIQGSGAILDWLEEQGVAGWQVAVESTEKSKVGELERRFDQVVGVHTRRLVYAATLLEDAEMVRPHMAHGAPRWQRVMSRLMWPRIRIHLIEALRLDPGAASESLGILDKELAHVDDLLAANGRFLIGDDLTRADISAASLLAPLARPRSHPADTAIQLPPWLEKTLHEWRQRPSLTWVAGLYAGTHRRPPPQQAALARAA